MEGLEKACGQHAIHKAFRYQVLYLGERAEVLSAKVLSAECVEEEPS